MKRQLLLGVTLIILLLLAPASEAQAGPEAVRPRKLAGDFADCTGRPTIVHFWGVTCGPCKVELPLLGKFMNEHSGFDMVTISADLVPEFAGRYASDAR